MLLVGTLVERDELRSTAQGSKLVRGGSGEPVALTGHGTCARGHGSCESGTCYAGGTCGSTSRVLQAGAGADNAAGCCGARTTGSRCRAQATDHHGVLDHLDALLDCCAAGER